MSVSDFNAKFNQLMMQVDDLCPMEEILYYLEGLCKEICKAVKTNLMNIRDIDSLKLAALCQDRVENPQQRNKNVVAEESTLASGTMTI